MDYREQLTHGDEGLPLAVYDVDSRHPRYRMVPHWHPEHELLYIEKGGFELILDGKKHRLVPGDVVFIQGGSIHSGEPIDCEYTCIVFSLEGMIRKNDICYGFASKLAEGQMTVEPQLLPGYGSLCERMVQTSKSGGESYAFLIKAFLFLLFGQLIHDKYCHEVNHTKEKKINARLKSVVEYVARNYGTSVTLGEMANIAGLSEGHLCRAFRTATGKTPIAYLCEYRLSQACYALVTGNRSITEIALECGFSDISYFIDLFKKTYGMTPGKYRIAMRER